MTPGEEEALATAIAAVVTALIDLLGRPEREEIPWQRQDREFLRGAAGGVARLLWAERGEVDPERLIPALTAAATSLERIPHPWQMVELIGSMIHIANGCQTNDPHQAAQGLKELQNALRDFAGITLKG